MTVRIVTDSVTDLPSQVVRELGITVIPLNVRFGTEIYRDGINLTSEQFYERLAKGKTFPVTSMPSPAVFAEAYDRLADEGDAIVAIILSSRLSGTFAVAQQSIRLMKRKCRIEVIDSKLAVMAQGLVVIAAASAARAGASLDEVVEITQKNIPRVELRAAFDTLEYLKRGGRIGAAQALLGSMLKVNPIITLKNGVVEPVGRAHSRAKALDHLCEFVMSFSSIEGMAVEDATTPDDADRLVERLSAKFPRERIYRSKASPVIGTHTGPGLLIVSVLGDK